MVFDLGRLPPEVRLLIWEATLPDRRVFHVSGLTEASNTPPTTEDSTERRGQIFSFYIRHAPPIAHEICHESRAVVLSRGYFLSGGKRCTGKPCSGLWLNPQRDMLYLDRNMRHCLKAKTPMPIHGLERVLHVGLEWRAWFRDVPRLPDGEDVQQQWKMAMGPLLLHCPRVESMSFVLPRVRHGGGVPSGREPYGAEKYEASLEMLSEEIKAPWGRLPVQIANGALVNYTGTALSQLGGGSVPVAWRVIRRQMEMAVGLLQDGGVKEVEDEGFHEPVVQRRKAVEVRGWWLVRPGARIGEEEDVEEFWE